MTSVWSASDAAANSMVLTNGGLTVTPSGVASWQSIRSSISKTTGKLYIEFFLPGVVSSSNQLFGLASVGFNPVGLLGLNNYSGGMWPGASNYVTSGFTSNYNTTLGAPTQGDVWALAVDFTVGNLWLAQNNIWANSSNPATGSLPAISFVLATTGALLPGMSFNGAGNGVWTLQPTAISQTYAPPSGFSAWDPSASHFSTGFPDGGVQVT